MIPANSGAGGAFDISLDAGAVQLNSSPLPPTAIGAIMNHANCLNGPFNFVSNPIQIEFIPR
jgi:hypothetical protein